MNFLGKSVGKWKCRQGADNPKILQMSCKYGPLPLIRPASHGNHLSLMCLSATKLEVRQDADVAESLAVSYSLLCEEVREVAPY